MELNPTRWSSNEWKAFGKHVTTYIAGGVTFAVATNLLSATDASTINEGISNITSGLDQIVKGIGLIAGVVLPIYNALRAKKNAEPASQAKAVADNLRRNGESTVPPEARKEIIGAVASMPEVHGVVVSTEGLATAIPEKNVVASPTDLKP